jgi:hypothetical protein
LSFAASADDSAALPAPTTTTSYLIMGEYLI